MYNSLLMKDWPALRAVRESSSVILKKRPACTATRSGVTVMNPRDCRAGEKWTQVFYDLAAPWTKANNRQTQRSR